MKLDKFKTKKEMLWYIQGIKEAKESVVENLNMSIEKYFGSMNFMDFDDKGEIVENKNILSTLKKNSKKKKEPETT